MLDIRPNNFQDIGLDIFILQPFDMSIDNCTQGIICIVRKERRDGGVKNLEQQISEENSSLSIAERVTISTEDICELVSYQARHVQRILLQVRLVTMDLVVSLFNISRMLPRTIEKAITCWR